VLSGERGGMKEKKKYVGQQRLFGQVGPDKSKTHLRVQAGSRVDKLNCKRRLSFNLRQRNCGVFVPSVGHQPKTSVVPWLLFLCTCGYYTDGVFVLCFCKLRRARPQALATLWNILLNSGLTHEGQTQRKRRGLTTCLGTPFFVFRRQSERSMHSKHLVTLLREGKFAVTQGNSWHVRVSNRANRAILRQPGLPVWLCLRNGFRRALD
jgi:hypothetical protein